MREGPWKTDVKPPEKCRCTRMVVDTLDETLDCPEGWYWVALAEAWVHS